MESFIPFTQTDHSIDIVGALIFASAIYYSIKYLILNNMSKQSKIIYGFIMVLSALHIFQVSYQLILGATPVSIRLWDFINYLTAFYFLISAHQIYKSRKK